ncbi:beta-Ala-His dipeptidase [Garra rufa]|uniref:beta-Ala-His dipeptidase n=1 Tax=Garra rufa TaxID=137080 RepID=UPI003CCE7BC3
MNCISLVCLLLCTGVSSFRFEELTQYVNSHEEEFIKTLRQWIAVESDSSDVTKRSDLHRMMDMTAEKLRLIGGSVEMVDVGMQSLPNGSSIALPKVVTAEFGSDPSKRTVCVYGHVDVQPAKKEDGWATEPYELTDIDGNLYGRGASDNKAPVLAWIHTVEVYKALNIDLPVNVKFIIEGMEETGSNGLDDMIVAQKDTFFSDVDYIIISDCVWLSKRPALTYGTRGNCYFFAEVTDYLHSVFAKRNSPNKLNVTMVIGAKPWLADPKHPLYEAGKAAVKRVFDVEPDLIREGGTIPIARSFQDVTGKSIIMLPIGGFDDGLHSQNEKISRYNYIEGTKLFIAYLHEVSQIKKY